MAKRKSEAEDGATGTLHGFEAKLTNLLALLLVKDMNSSDQMDMLNRAGFKTGEIAALLGAKTNTVTVTLLRKRKSK